MRSTQITFKLPDTAAEHDFLQQYMVPAWERFRKCDAFTSGWFWRAGSFPDVEFTELTREEHDLTRLTRGMIVFVINGDPETIIDAECDRWQAYRSEGLLDGWSCQSYRPTYRNAREKLFEKYGQVGGARAYQLRIIAAETTIRVLAAFDERLPAVGSQTEDNPVPIGYWAMTHFLMKQQGYGWYDEIDACTKAIRSRLISLASFAETTTATAVLEETIAELEAVRDEL